MRAIAVVTGLALLAGCSSMHMMHHEGAPAPAPVAGPAATPAPAAAPAPAVLRVGGDVTAVSASQISVRGADGAVNALNVGADTWIVKGRPIQASEIHSGDFVATANTNNADGTGTSTELRVFPPGLHLGEGSYAMSQPNTTMTNATVSQVTSVGADRQITVTYAANASNNSPAGTRTITLPASVQVVQWYRVQTSDVHVGERARGRGHADASGATVADFIFVDTAPPATPPAAH